MMLAASCSVQLTLTSRVDPLVQARVRRRSWSALVDTFTDERGERITVPSHKSRCTRKAIKNTVQKIEGVCYSVSQTFGGHDNAGENVHPKGGVVEANSGSRYHVFMVPTVHVKRLIQC